MHVNQKMAAELQAALSGAWQSRHAETEAERFHVGAVWYGNWREDADRGAFGTPEKPRHNACVARKSPSRTRFTLCPVTSHEQRGTAALVLPAGAVPGGEFTASWLLTRFLLVATRTTLETRFAYKCNLPADCVRRMKEMMSR